jgi:hypothetical protein
MPRVSRMCFLDCNRDETIWNKESHVGKLTPRRFWHCGIFAYLNIGQNDERPHPISLHPSSCRLTKPVDTVGELRSAAICVSYMPSLKAKKLEKLTREKAVLER